MDYMNPFTKWLELSSGKFKDPELVQKRQLSDMKGFFADAAAVQERTNENPLIYEVYLANNGQGQEGQLGYSTTLIYPGTIGEEYFMTKGHYHAKSDRAELYYCLQGEGFLLMQTPEGKVTTQKMSAGAATYVPPYWGHRTLNSGEEPFVFLAVYPADAGYDYASIQTKGFASIMLERNGKATLVNNPNYEDSTL